MTLLRRLGGAPGDRGAVAALVAVLLSGNVLLGMAALTIDVGLLYAEREELQSGADAAAVAVAKACVNGNNVTCRAATVAGLASSFANQNASDGVSNATLCGRVPTLPSGSGNLLPPCGAPGGGLSSCIGAPPPAPQPFVEVRTDTQTAGGGTILPYAFAQTVVGAPGSDVGACSRVSWGPVDEVDSGDTLGIAISRREFDAVYSRTGLEPWPDGGHRARRSSEVTLLFRQPRCPGGGGGGGGACGGPRGGFGFLTNGLCRPALDVGDGEMGYRLPTDPRVRPRVPNGCGNRIANLHDNLTPIAVPLFNSTTTRDFIVAGIAVFVVTGWFATDEWRSPPNPPRHSSDLTGAAGCPGSDPRRFCIYGYFTTRVFDAGDRATLGDPHFGAVHVRTIG
ncbi:pilus assembly protein TadG-related protein [Phytohabitans rumicis]|uniref:Putative Flp pilus-assembly TadG-like N-terminal domain-containing protein n=1 Tax=Phytohabitans rumicis TaxID=1076125 RepID=A0A6V8L946_9ACTN|nr:pilus assembly protein TadG-related protein [Phytohabitans rumicis]GFJ90626.1 hypothetical protein Prum_042680 [Phytohabitans rumicis]